MRHRRVKDDLRHSLRRRNLLARDASSRDGQTLHKNGHGREIPGQDGKLKPSTVCQFENLVGPKVIHSGKSTAIAEGRIQDPDGMLYARCTTTFLRFPTAY